jgi:hypothetical protein
MVLPQKYSQAPSDVVSDDEEEVYDESMDNQPQQVSGCWSFSLGDNRFYIVIKRIVSFQYQVTIENDGTEVHITAKYSPSTEDIVLVAKQINIPPSFVIPQLQPVTFTTVLTPPVVLENTPVMHSEKEDHWITISFAEKKSNALVF